jgi:hypothetical protein
VADASSARQDAASPAVDLRAFLNPPPRRSVFRAWVRGPLHEALLVTLGGLLVAIGVVLGHLGPIAS